MPGKVQMPAADAIVVSRRRAEQLRREVVHVDAHLLAEIAPEGVRSVAQSVRKQARRGVEQDPRGIDAASTDNDPLGGHYALRA